MKHLEKINYKGFILPIIVGVAIWFSYPFRPVAISIAGWHMFAIFIATIIGCITKPLPIAGVALIGYSSMIFLGIVPMKGPKGSISAISAFGNTTPWMIAMAYMISRGFIKTKLGHRIALHCVKHFGKKTMGLVYSMAVIDLVTSPATPSNTARAGGIVLPIIKSLAKTFGSDPKDGTEKKIGAFLIFTEYHINIITSAMFMTAMAPNIVAIGLANQQNINISWITWALAGLVPGIIALILIPFVIYKIYPPEIKTTPNAKKWAQDQLNKMGKMTLPEKVMIIDFIGALTLWMLASFIKMDNTLVAFLAVAVLLICGVLTVKDLLNETGAWNVIIWFSILIFMASQLAQKDGFIPWFSKTVADSMQGFSWGWVIAILCIVYFYSHYLFASITAHVTAMFGSLLSVAIAASVPAALAVMLLVFTTSIMTSSTHYASGPAPVLFGTGYIKQNDWWRLNFILGFLYLIIFLGIGTIWMKLIGMW